MKRIPKAFRLAGHKFEVTRASCAELEKIIGKACYACFLPDRLSIVVQHKDRTIKQSVLLQAFWHEVAHALLWVMGHKDWSNEKVVDQMGHLLKQFHDTVE